MGKGKQRRNIINHFEAGSNCQVFNGNISGCVFAMPGANVTQQSGEAHGEGQKEEPKDESQGLVNLLKPMFFGNEAEARDFLASVQGMKPKQITEKVNLLVAKRKISDLSRKRDLWKVLHECGIYTPSESNWNSMVK